MHLGPIKPMFEERDWMLPACYVCYLVLWEIAKLHWRANHLNKQANKPSSPNSIRFYHLQSIATFCQWNVCNTRVHGTFFSMSWVTFHIFLTHSTLTYFFFAKSCLFGFCNYFLQFVIASYKIVIFWLKAYRTLCFALYNVCYISEFQQQLQRIRWPNYTAVVNGRLSCFLIWLKT